MKAAVDLFAAVYENDLASFRRASTAQLAVVDEHRRSVLFCAVLEGRFEIVAHLIARGAEVDPRRGAKPLLAAVMRNRPREAKLLIRKGAAISNARDKDGDPLLVTAAFRESTAVLRVLLAHPHTVADTSLALLEAAGVGNLAICKLLLRHDANPAWRSSKGNSALSIARKKRKSDVVALLTAHLARGSR